MRWLNLFQIGEFSKLSGTSSRMLRHYEKQALLIPDKKDPITGYRYYTAQQLTTINQIKQLQKMGFSLATIQTILSSENVTIFETQLSIREKELQKEVEVLKTQQAMIDSIQQLFDKKMAYLDYAVVKKTLPKRQVMSLRKHISNASDEYTLWQKLYEEVEKQHVEVIPAFSGISIYHDPEYKEKNVDLEVQNTVTGTYMNTPEILFRKIDEMAVASVTFSGPYTQLPQVMEALARWIEVHSYQISGPMFNVNHVSPATEQNSEKWVTESCIPIERKNDE